LCGPLPQQARRSRDRRRGGFGQDHYGGGPGPHLPGRALLPRNSHHTRDVLKRHSESLYVATFGDRPGRLFDGMEHCRASIFNSMRCPSVDGGTSLFCTKYHRWPSVARGELFTTLGFVLAEPIKSLFPGRVPKLPSPTAVRLFKKANGPSTRPLGLALSTRPTNISSFIRSPPNIGSRRQSPAILSV